MTLYRSKPTLIDAVQWTGDNEAAMFEFGGDKVRVSATLSVTPPIENAGPKNLELVAGKDGAQEWVPVPVGHWLVCQPGDKTDIWPVEASYFAAKYEPSDG